MNSKEGLEIGDRFNHKGRGLCTFTEFCFALEAMNPDLTSTFVLLNGDSDEIEVSIALLEKLEFEPPIVCQLCFRSIEEGAVCSFCSKKLSKQIEKK